ncbi:MAG: hypothetical protein IPO92_04085 [Saprospiraceae bacterium]|nr:hypothetical protein [Saprospiraceae bacterium]
MKTRFYTILLSLFVTNVAFNQCTITDLNVTPTECNVNGNFFVEIDFNHVGTSVKFRVLGNGTNYGLFEYEDLPIKLGPLEANCTTNYEFVVRDAEIETCLAFKNIGTKCCDDLCKIEFKNVETGECHDGKYTLNFDLNHENTSPNGFDLFNNGQFYGYYQYSQLPLKLENFPSSTTETFNKIAVCANDNNNCCDTLTLVNPCICSIYRVQTQVIECNEDTETFSIRLNFKHKLNADSFRVGGNSVNYGTFAYKDLPITIKNLHFSPVTEYEFLIVDVEDAFCFASYDLGIVTECNFDCSIYDVIAEPYECSDGKFYVAIALKYKNTSLEGFTIRGNGQVYGSFEYGEPFYKIGPLNGDCITKYEFVVKDKELHDCAASPVFLGPICCEQHCALSELTIVEHCENNDLVAFDINFNHTMITGSFVLRINNIYVGTYLYADLPIKITNTSYAPNAVIKIFDAGNEACNLIKEYTFNCAKDVDCKLYDLTVKATDCNNDHKFYAILKFFSNNHGNHGFIVKVNGEVWDTLEYGKESYEIGPLNGDCETIYHFLIQDVAHPDCADDYSFSEKICCNQACKLYDLTVKATDCNDDHKFYAILKFFSNNHGNHGFIVKVNGEVWDTLEYGKESYEIGPLNGDCTTIYHF